MNEPKPKLNDFHQWHAHHCPGNPQPKWSLQDCADEEAPWDPRASHLPVFTGRSCRQVFEIYRGL